VGGFAGREPIAFRPPRHQADAAVGTPGRTLGATLRRPNYAAVIAHDPVMADRVQLAADVSLVTSSDEPCGIVQFESMARATPPLARAVGGLKDTVLPHTEAGGTGFVFGGATREAVLRGLVAAVLEASRVHRNEPELFRQVQRNALQARFLWPTAARR
jgi:starch synthase